MALIQLLHNLRNRKRLEEILHVFGEEEFGYFLLRTKLHRFLPFHKRIKAYLSRQRAISPEVRLRQAFERLGPTFLKFGQLLSLRPDLIPASYSTEFEKMQDHVPPVPFFEVKKIIEEEFHKPLSKIFSSFSPAPIASASIAQVHQATIGQAKVAVKVQRPNIKEIIEADIAIMKLLAAALERYVPKLQAYHIRQLIHEFERWTVKELNFTIEAFYAKKIAENFRGSSTIKIPKIYDDYTSGRILVMEFIDGTPLSNIKKLRQQHANLHRVIKNGFEATLQQVYVDGLFHADPHPGNILVMKKGKIAYVDFGIVGQFSKQLQQQCLNVLQALIENDEDKLVAAIFRMSSVENMQGQEAAFRRDVAEIFERMQFQSLKDINISKMLQDLLHLIHAYRLRVPPDFILFAKTIITLEGVALKYDPSFHFLYECRGSLEKIFDHRYAVREAAGRLRKHVTAYRELAENFPETAAELLRKAKQFKLDIKVDDREMRNLTEELERSSGNMALGMIIAALIVGSSLLLQTAVPALIPFFGYILAGLIGLWLIHRTLFHIIQQRGEEHED